MLRTSFKKLNLQTLLMVCALSITTMSAQAESVQSTCDRSQQAICLGDRVMSGSLQTGSVLQIFASGRLLVRFDRQMRAEILSPGEVISAVSCSGQICQGALVTNFLNQRGQVAEVFANGWARIILQDSQRSVLRKVTEISIDR